jgi:hypothetical protein
MAEEPLRAPTSQTTASELLTTLIPYPYRTMKNHKPSQKPDFPWARVGAVIGACVPLLLLGSELFHRLLHSARGGRGESAAWGEPLFYIVLLAVPLAGVGYLVGRRLKSRD